ncbi:MAG: hypothetical protein ACE5PV_24405 [Candidatus Poribacteria bacterium]
MAVRFHPHARECMAERDATEDEVEAAVEQGEQFPARFGRTGFRHYVTAMNCLTTNLKSVAFVAGKENAP